MAKLNESVSKLERKSFLFSLFLNSRIASRFRFKFIFESLLIYYCVVFQIDMEAPEFKDFAKTMTDYIAEYLENIRDR